jgi:hypothetical protein
MLVCLLLAALAVFIFERLFDTLTAKEGFESPVAYKTYPPSCSIMEHRNAKEYEALQKSFDNLNQSDKTSIQSMMQKASSLVMTNTRQIEKIAKEIEESKKKK